MMQFTVARDGERQSGYVLLAVLVCLILAGYVSVNVARRSLAAKLAAHQYQQRVQARWAAQSLRESILGEANRALGVAGDPEDVPIPVVERRLELAGKTVRIVLSDEDAKLNLNAAYHSVGLMETARIVREAGFGNPAAVRLMPRVASQMSPLDGAFSDEDPSLPDAFASWGDVLDLTQFVGPALRSHQALSRANMMTCWGQGRLNYRSASSWAILRTAELACSPAVAQQLLSQVQENREVPINRHIVQLEIDSEEQEELKRMFADTSNSFSLWVIDEESERMYVRVLDIEQGDRREQFMSF